MNNGYGGHLNDHKKTETKRDNSAENIKEREKGTHSQEIELALTQLQKEILKVGRNFNVLISEVTGDPPENYLEDEATNKAQNIEKSVQVPLLTVLQESPDQLRYMSQKVEEIGKRIEYLRGILTGTLS